MEGVLWYVLTGTRGGTNRIRILRELSDRPRNANRLAEELHLDYKTVRHHLDLLEENGVVTTMGDGYGKMYFVSDEMESNMDVLAEIAEQANLGDVSG